MEKKFTQIAFGGRNTIYIPNTATSVSNMITKLFFENIKFIPEKYMNFKMNN